MGLDKVLEKTWLIRKRKDGSHRFNVFNPLAYIVLIVYALLGAVTTATKEFFKLIVDTFKDSIEYNYEWTIVIWISAGLIFMATWLL